MSGFPRPIISLIAAAFSAAMAAAAADRAAAQQSTTATYDDWILQCRIEAGPPAQKLCDIAQVTTVQGKNVPFSRVTIQHPVKGQPVRLIVQLPTNISMAANVRIQASDSDPGIAAPFARCLPSGCFADFDLKDDVIKKFRAGAGTTGKVSFKDAGEHELVIPLSFNGFGQAFDALAKE
jgi:invasion protein IalB